MGSSEKLDLGYRPITSGLPDNVDWIVEGTHPLAGHYHSKAEFLAHTFEKLAKVLPERCGTACGTCACKCKQTLLQTKSIGIQSTSATYLKTKVFPQLRSSASPTP
jgi:bacterioferritin-associated ferredoxin